MFVRAMLLFLATLLLITAISSVVAPRRLHTGHGAAALSAAARNPAPPPGPGDVREVTLHAPRAKPLVVGVGDIVHVVANVNTDDVAEFSALGVDAPVSPGVPAQFDVITDSPGSFPLTLRYSGRKIGELKVEKAA